MGHIWVRLSDYEIQKKDRTCKAKKSVMIKCDVACILWDIVSLQFHFANFDKWRTRGFFFCRSTGLFKMIVGVLTTCHTQYAWDTSTCIFYLIEQHSQFLLHNLQVLYMCTLCDSTNINTIIEFVPNLQVVKTPIIILNNPVCPNICKCRCISVTRKWIIGLMSAVSHKTDIIQRLWCTRRVSLPIRGWYFTDLSAIPVYRLYEMRQGIMNKPAY